MNQGLTSEQRQLVGAVRELAQGEFRRDGLKYMAGTFPWPNLRKLADLRYQTLIHDDSSPDDEERPGWEEWLRFAGVTIPAGATITSARLEVTASSTQWQRIAFDFGMEAAASSAAFSASSLPSQRTLLVPRVSHSSDAQWLAGTAYQLDQIATILQAVVNQPAWTSGNAVGLVLRGTGQAWGRKFTRFFDGDPAAAPRLVVTYTVP